MARTASTAVAKSKANLPVSIDEEMAKEVAELQSRLSAPSGDRVTISKKGVFKLPNGAEGPEMSVVIVDFISANYFYDKPFVEGEAAAPACFALGLNPKEMVPSPNAPAPQADSCATCWANEFGSAPNGKGKACANNRLLSLMAPDATAETPMMLLKVPVTSVKGFDGYVNSVADVFHKPVRAVVTRISSDPTSDYQSVVFGNPVPLEKEQLLLAHSRREEAMKRLMTEPDVSTYTPPAPVKTKGRAPASARAGR